jgi:electron transport complex protein RnfG
MSQFRNKLVEEFVVVKTSPSADNEIESITGSTITSKAVANACNAAIVYVKSLVGGA